MSDPRVFVAYARTDLERVRAIVEVLRTAGIQVDWDQDLRSGVDWGQHLASRIRRADYFLWMMSPASVNSTQVLDEFTAARESGAGVRVIDLGGVEAQDAVPSLARIHWDHPEGLTSLVADVVRSSARRDRTRLVGAGAIAVLLLAALSVSGPRGAWDGLREVLGGSSDANTPETPAELRAKLREAEKRIQELEAGVALKELPDDTEVVLGAVLEKGRWKPAPNGGMAQTLAASSFYEGEEPQPYSIGDLRRVGALEPTSAGIYSLYAVLAFASNDRAGVPAVWALGSGDGVNVYWNEVSFDVEMDSNPTLRRQLQEVQGYLLEYHQELVDAELLNP